MVKCEGCVPVEKLPIAVGDRVVIKRGTTINHPRLGVDTAGKTYKVIVTEVENGVTENGVNKKNPRVFWKGLGGYQRDADINDVEKYVEEVVAPKTESAE